jgi:hypothetical protein
MGLRRVLRRECDVNACGAYKWLGSTDRPNPGLIRDSIRVMRPPNGLIVRSTIACIHPPNQALSQDGPAGHVGAPAFPLLPRTGPRGDAEVRRADDQQGIFLKHKAGLWINGRYAWYNDLNSNVDSRVCICVFRPRASRWCSRTWSSRCSSSGVASRGGAGSTR